MQPGTLPVFSSSWLMIHSVMTTQDVYVCVLAAEYSARMSCVCFDVARESGNVKYPCKVSDE